MSNVPNIKRKFNGHVFTLGLETQTKARAEKNERWLERIRMESADNYT